MASSAANVAAMLPPRRPRQHVVADDSFRAFGDALPAEWVVREQKPDYAIDAQVQIFDGERATPTFFFVQLKSTDSPSYDGSALKYVFDTSDLFFWRSFDCPVMLAVFDAQKRAFAYEWVPAIFARTPTPEVQAWQLQKTVTLKLGRPLRLEDAPRVRAEAEHALRELGVQTSLARPFGFSVTGEDTARVDSARADLRQWLHANEATQLRVVAATGEPANLHIDTANGGVRMQYLGLEFEVPFQPDRDDDLALLLKTLTCALVAVAGYSRVASSLLEDLLADRTALASHVGGFLLSEPGMTLFAKAGRAYEGLELASRLAADGHTRAAGLLAAGCRAAGDRSEFLEQKYREVLLRLTQFGDDAYKGTQHYNLANSLRKSCEHRAAVHAFARAAELEPRYLERPYWWRERAGCLYLAGCYRLAAMSYEHACDLEPGNAFNKALLADTLLTLGRFTRAGAVFEDYLRSTTSPLGEHLLKAWLAPFLASKFGDTRREPLAAIAATHQATLEPDPQRRLDALLAARRRDPLCEFAWWHLAPAEIAQLGADAEETWLAAGIIVTLDIEALVNAVVACTRSKGEEAALFVSALLAVGATRFGEEALLETLVERFGLSKEADRENQAEMIRLARQFMSLPERPPLDIRWPDGRTSQVNSNGDS